MTQFPIRQVRAKFPALALSDNGAPRIYLDNPAGTQMPGCAIDAAANAMIASNANLGGRFVTSVAAERIVQSAHEAMAAFVNAHSYREIVIGPSMTALTFQLARSLGRAFHRGDEIVVTRMDHDGNVAPWLTLAEELGLAVRWVDFDPSSWKIEPAALAAVLSERTRLVALNYASNLTGSVNDVAALTAIAKQAGCIVYVDAVQYAPHGAIDVRALGCDFLACSSYKFFGPHLGIVWGRESLLEALRADKVRPQTEDLPWRFEQGTPQIELQAALSATIDYFSWLGSETAAGEALRDRIEAAFVRCSRWEGALTLQLLQGLPALPGVTVYGITDAAAMNQRVPTVSFRHRRVAPDAIVSALAQRNIFAWSGHNFALETVRRLRIDENEGVVRIGIAHYNTAAEIERTLEVLLSLIT